MNILYVGIGANQKVANQLDVIPVLLELLRNDPLDNNQKLCIVMCLAVLTDGNGNCISVEFVNIFCYNDSMNNL